MKRSTSNEHWKRMRRNHLDVYPECRACGGPGSVVHHLRYRGPRGRSEKPGDLVTMCPPCHSALHASYGPMHSPISKVGLVRHTLDFIAAFQTFDTTDWAGLDLALALDRD